ncbi:PqqD family peptide modification chaperone [Methanobacterium petrolearium]|uniref:PqqD family protein n=1 Tax=Methanobacterium petrolearium TaxID=710190 RepID=UPI001AE1AD1B
MDSEKIVRAENQARLIALNQSLNSFELSYIDYKKAEKDVEELASQILEVYSPENLESFVFKPIPRGGFIVLGMLAYALNLNPSQFEFNTNPKQPIMIVDDIALTGARIAEILSKNNFSHVVIAHLYSPPQLRNALMENEPCVKNCFSAHDLEDHAPHNYIGDYSLWEKQVSKKMCKRYWIGQSDVVGFAWSETDYFLWNPVTKRLEDGWRLLAPHKCLKNKFNLGISSQRVEKQDIKLSEDVVSGIFSDEILLYHRETGEIFSLSGVAAMIWRVLMTLGNVEATVKYLKEYYDVEEDVLRRDVEKYVSHLFETKILKKEVDL